MPLNNFGSICNFAEAMEKLLTTFYESAAANPACAAMTEHFQRFARDSRKQTQTLQRVRRENVTEMILEPIQDFHRQPFAMEFLDPADRALEEILEDARRLEETAEAFYRSAMEKIKALPEAARAMKTIGKKHTAHRQELAASS